MNTVRIYIADTRQLLGREAEASPLLTPQRRADAEKIKPFNDRLHSIAAGLLLGRVLGVTSDADLKKGEQGKPELAGEGPCFNLSHGGNYAVLAVSDYPVGVDVEPIGEKIPIAIPRRFLRPDELAWLEEDLSPIRFAQLWTRLESALKADGRGFAMDCRDFSVLESGNPWYLETVQYKEHCISCALSAPFELDIICPSAADLLEENQP